MEDPTGYNLTQAQNELYEWIKKYMSDFQHSPSIRQMMQAMGLKSPAPIQSRLKHLQEKGYISWQEGKARTMQIVDEMVGSGVPIMGSVAAGGLVETYSDVQENLDISDVLKKKNVFALTVNGDSMIDACIAHGDMVLMEPIKDSFSIKNGTIVSAMVPGSGSTLKYFCKISFHFKFSNCQIFIKLMYIYLIISVLIESSIGKVGFLDPVSRKADPVTKMWTGF